MRPIDAPLPEFRFDPGGDRPRDGHRPLRPRDAATLLIVDRDGPRPRVLMGRRHAGHRFMPGKYVFPGGSVDPGDWRVPVASDFSPAVMDKLLNRMRGRRSEARARGLALAAVRETLEETGLLIGTPAHGPLATRQPAWQPFRTHRVMPELAAMMLVARAITPPNRPRRFDTRFFAVEASAIAARSGLPPDEAGELLELDWLTFDAARRLDLPNITRLAIDLLEMRFSSPDPASSRHPVPFYHLRGRRSICEQL